MTTVVFALPCPNGSGILYKGDAVEEVIRQCGEPIEKKTVTKIVNSQQEWVYYRPHFFDEGFAQIIILFKNDRVSSIHITDRYPYTICRKSAVQVGLITTIQTSCGDWIYDTAYTNLCGIAFGVGDSANAVESVCGPPETRSILQTDTMEVTELTYGGDHPQTIVFYNGKLTEWK